MAKNIIYNNFTVDATVRAGLKNQKPKCVWITGLSGAGGIVHGLNNKKLKYDSEHLKNPKFIARCKYLRFKNIL